MSDEEEEQFINCWRHHYTINPFDAAFTVVWVFGTL